MENKLWVIYCDGGVDRNKMAYYSFHIYRSQLDFKKPNKKYLSLTFDNTEAEMFAMLRAMEAVVKIVTRRKIDCSMDSVLILSDSQAAVQWANGFMNRIARSAELYTQLKNAADRFHYFNSSWVPRKTIYRIFGH